MSNKSVSVDPRHGPVVGILRGEGFRAPETTARQVLTALDALPVAVALEPQAAAMQKAIALTVALNMPPSSGHTSVAAILQSCEAVAKELRTSRDETRGRCDELQRELDATKAGLGSALNLRAVFLAQAEVREARAQHEHASVKLDRALLKEQIANAVSRGHLSADFYAQLREWTK